MVNRNLRLPEPTLPEHELIRDSAPIPELSAGFRSRVMVECASSISRAKRIWRWKAAGAASAICCLGLLACLSLPPGSDDSQLTEQPSVPDIPGSPGYSPGYSSDSSMSVDARQGRKEPVKSEMDELIETLNERGQNNQKFNARMF